MIGGDSSAHSLIRAIRAFLLRQLKLALGLGLLLVLAINCGVRWTGGSVNPLSISRLGDRARALGMLAAHRISCPFHSDDVEEALREASARHGVPYRLVLSVARTESSLKHTVISSTGAMGVMQLMPNTARELGVDDPFSIEQNVDGGVRYLKLLLTTYRGNVRRALAAYNAGPARISKKGPLSMPDETRTYVSRIISRM
ncbi:MAG: Lytic transglycosylase catalytic [Myxococcaceae bacterium]|nr:Lytic transglycosylase catalytic [Myxococcaceae bacterium]